MLALATTVGVCIRVMRAVGEATPSTWTQVKALFAFGLVLGFTFVFGAMSLVH